MTERQLSKCNKWLIACCVLGYIMAPFAGIYVAIRSGHIYSTHFHRNCFFWEAENKYRSSLWYANGSYKSWKPWKVKEFKDGLIVRKNETTLRNQIKFGVSWKLTFCLYTRLKSPYSKFLQRSLYKKANLSRLNVLQT